jgi:hypothetical protein
MKKTLFALAAATVLAYTSGAFAQYTGYANRDVVAEPIYAQALPTAKFAGHNQVMSRKAHALKQSAIEVPENRLGDRYPIFAGNNFVASGASMIVAYDVPESLNDRYPAPAQTIRATNAGHKMTNVRQATTAIEVPENRLGDRFPFLVSSKQSAKNRV